MSKKKDKAARTAAEQPWAEWQTFDASLNPLASDRYYGRVVTQPSVDEALRRLIGDKARVAEGVTDRAKADGVKVHYAKVTDGQGQTFSVAIPQISVDASPGPLSAAVNAGQPAAGFGITRNTAKTWPISGTHYPTGGYTMRPHQLTGTQLHGGMGDANVRCAVAPAVKTTLQVEAEAADALERQKEAMAPGYKAMKFRGPREFAEQYDMIPKDVVASGEMRITPEVIVRAMKLEVESADVIGRDPVPEPETTRSLEHDFALRANPPNPPHPDFPWAVDGGKSRKDAGLTHALEEDLSHMLHKEVHLEAKPEAERGQTVSAPTTPELHKLLQEQREQIKSLMDDVKTLKLIAEAQASDTASDGTWGPEGNPKLAKVIARKAPWGVASAKVDVLRQAFAPEPEPENFLEALLRQREKNICRTQELVSRLEALVERVQGPDTLLPAGKSATQLMGIIGKHAGLTDWAEEMEERLARVVHALETLA